MILSNITITILRGTTQKTLDCAYSSRMKRGMGKIKERLSKMFCVATVLQRLARSLQPSQSVQVDASSIMVFSARSKNVGQEKRTADKY